jgi:hypothetical protein
MKTAISTRIVPSILALIFGVIAGGSFAGAQTTTDAQTQKSKASAKLDLDLLNVISRGETNRISELAQDGADLNRSRVVIDIEDLHKEAGWFLYKFKTAVGAPIPMEQAIVSEQVESVRELLALGVDVKSGFYEAANTGPFPIDSTMIASASRGGQEFSIKGPTGVKILFVTKEGVVHSIVAPKSAKKSNCLEYAERLLASAKDDKSRQKLEDIVAILRAEMK